MSIEEVVHILTEFNKWRRSEPPYEWNEDPAMQKELPYSPKDIGLAIDEAVVMLRQKADILDCIQKEIDIIEKMPTADLDGSFANQKVNGERLMAKIAFYQKVKKIVGEAHNV